MAQMPGKSRRAALLALRASPVAQLHPVGQRRLVGQVDLAGRNRMKGCSTGTRTEVAVHGACGGRSS
jgi:hypothetical protein